jgi:hypothetical protein
MEMGFPAGGVEEKIDNELVCQYTKPFLCGRQSPRKMGKPLKLGAERFNREKNHS